MQAYDHYLTTTGRVSDGLKLCDFSIDTLKRESVEEIKLAFKTARGEIFKYKLDDYRKIGALMREIEGASCAPVSRSLSTFRENKAFANWLYDCAGMSIDKQIRGGAISEYKAPEIMPNQFVFHLCLLANALEGSFEERLLNLKKYFTGMRCLEIGPGCGYEMKIMRELGAEIIGIEIERSCKDSNVLMCDARKESLGNNEFGLIYSINVFANGILSRDDAISTAYNIRQALKVGGVSFHQIHLESLSRAQFLFQAWFTKLTLRMSKLGIAFDEVDSSAFKDLLFQVDNECQKLSDVYLNNFDLYEQQRWAVSNTPSLSPEELERVGFKVDNLYLHDSAYSIMLS